MKSVELEIQKEKINGQDMFFSDFELLKMAINFRPREQGIDIEEMMKRLRILGELEKQAKELDVEEKNYTDAVLETKVEFSLEDADFEKLKSLVKACQWGIVAQSIVKLYEKFK